MDKPIRLAACEPCRQAKLACDHARPVCQRCTRSHRTSACVYRERPFKKRRGGDNALLRSENLAHNDTIVPPELNQNPSLTEAVAEEHHYPNAGYQGFSSHVTFFNSIASEEIREQSRLQRLGSLIPRDRLRSMTFSQKQAKLLSDATTLLHADSISRFLDFWLAKKINLPLSGTFSGICAKEMNRFLQGKLFDGDMPTTSRKLSENSLRTLNCTADSSIGNLYDKLSNLNLRWETLTLGLIIIGRATTDIPFFPPLYACRSELREFQQTITELADRFLETTLSLDCMNEILLICQYENFILHSVIDGDQSYNAWRRLGDVISSLLFLGLNEKIESGSSVPVFLAELRRSIFAQIYSDDKNMAVFLGRPPRLSRNFCCFQLPSIVPNEACSISSPGRPLAVEAFRFFKPEDQLNEITSLRWTACCASLKEDILESLNAEQIPVDERTRSFSNIQKRAESLWDSLPTSMKLHSSLRHHRDKSPLQRDFLLGIRLTYLQVVFLLTNGTFNHCRDSAGDDVEASLLQTSQEMLSLVVEAIVLRDQLVNSGTSLLWKVAHYGLPAAGVMCLFMLRPTFWRTQVFPIAKALQDLGTLASQVQIGGLLEAGDPNYELLCRATRTIENLLRVSLSYDRPPADLRRVDPVEEATVQPWIPQSEALAPFNPLAYNDLWGYEYDFWHDLDEHSLLLNPFDDPS